MDAVGELIYVQEIKTDKSCVSVPGARASRPLRKAIGVEADGTSALPDRSI